MRGVVAVSISVVLWCALTPRAVIAQGFGFGRSWEPCVQQNHCAGDLICAKVAPSPDNEFNFYTACKQGDPNAPTCACLPVGGPQKCSSSADCSAQEVCARQPDSDENNNCVSCYSIGTEPFWFKPVEDNDSTCSSLPTFTPFPTVTPSPKSSPPSRIGDYCYDVLACDDDSFCHGPFDPDVACYQDDSVCQCGSTPYTLCSDSSNCDEGTACALDVFNNANICISCVAIAQRVNFIPVDDTAKECEKMDPVPSPPVPISVYNGQTYDYCRSPSTCSDDRRCIDIVSFQNSCPVGDENSTVCVCAPLAPLPQCNSSSDCVETEGCATLPGVALPHCYSLGLINNLGLTNVKVFGHKELPTVENPGFSGSSCRFDWECAEPRRCTHRSEIGLNYGGCAGRSQCICESLVPVRCAVDDDCNSGEEVCVHIIGARTSSICRSAAAVGDDPLYERVGAGTNTTVPEATGEDSNSSGGSGLSGDTCFGDTECISGICRHVTEQNSVCDGRDGCFCVPKSPSCSGDADCESGEQCVFIEDQIPSLVPAKCLSVSAIDRHRIVYVSYAAATTPSPSPSTSLASSASAATDSVTTGLTPTPEPESCIDLKALSDLSAKDLVFKDSRRATVLCDTDGSCATPGHVVEWNGTPMMMQSYCNVFASCSYRIMWVNSPRMRAGLRITSRTDGLKFTALAARYGSRLEEHVLRLLLRSGL